MLTKAAVERTASGVRARMGKNGALLERLVAMLEPAGTVNMASALAELYPGEGRQEAQAKLRQLRLELKRVAAKAGVRLELAGDRKTRSAAEEQWLWFEGEDQLLEEAEKWVAPNVRGPARFGQDAVKLGPVQVYVAYAEADEKQAKKLLAELDPLFRRDGIEVWHRGMILLGRHIEEEMNERRRSADLTVQLLSPHFLADERDSEAGPRTLQVVLCGIPNEPEGVKLFRHGGKCFRDAKPGQFALALFQQIRAVVAKQERDLETDLSALARHELKCVPSAGTGVSLERELETPGPVSNRRDAIAFLEEWLLDPKAPPYCALLGELGMGKTTTAMEFARRLWERRRKGDRTPVAVYLYLRAAAGAAARNPGIGLDEIVREILRREWKGGPLLKPPEPEAIYKAVEQGALVIVDGLDEVLVHLLPRDGQEFTRQLFRIVPPGARAGRRLLLLTCRTHYFRTVREQSAHFTLEDRDGVKAESYRALMLLRFEKEQILTYLRNTVPERKAEEVWGVSAIGPQPAGAGREAVHAEPDHSATGTAGEVEDRGADGDRADAVPLRGGGVAAARRGEAPLDSRAQAEADGARGGRTGAQRGAELDGGGAGGVAGAVCGRPAGGALRGSEQGGSERRPADGYLPGAG
jgi:hypothetical protein